ncbi:hypothetical protein BDQ17DRAFT_1518687 [Cyathus striatus]|nr:hypothetical protein BDQ17DRAFT_1518687 [Cyathus striatus]
MPDTSELDANEEEIETNNELSQYSTVQLTQFRFPTFSHRSKELEDVYIVLCPINFKHSSKEMLQCIGEFTDMAELQHYLLFQHWGVKVSIWQTGKTHEEHVMNELVLAIAIIRMMGGFKKDDEVEVYGDHSGLKEHPIPDEECQKYRHTGPKPRQLIPMLAMGEYNAVLNNCINFSTRYVFHHIFNINPMTISPRAFRKRMLWVVNKWISSGCKLKKEKLMDMFMSPLGLLNPMRTLTRTSDGNLFFVRVILVFMGKIHPEGVAPAKGDSSGMNVIKESDVKAVAPQVLVLVDLSQTAHVYRCEDGGAAQAVHGRLFLLSFTLLALALTHSVTVEKAGCNALISKFKRCDSKLVATRLVNNFLNFPEEKGWVNVFDVVKDAPGLHSEVPPSRIQNSINIRSLSIPRYKHSLAYSPAAPESDLSNGTQHPQAPTPKTVPSYRFQKSRQY